MLEFYRQCTFSSGLTQSIAWLPEQLAHVGKMIYFGPKSPQGTLWVIEKVGPVRMDGEYLKRHERDYLTQREASDI